MPRKHDWHGAHARLSEQLGRAPKPSEIAKALDTSPRFARESALAGRCPQLSHERKGVPMHESIRETIAAVRSVQGRIGRCYMPEVAALLGITERAAYKRLDTVFKHTTAFKRLWPKDRRCFRIVFPKSAEADTRVAPGSPATHLPVHSAGVPSGAPASFVREG